MLLEDRLVGHRQSLDLEGVARCVFAKGGLGLERQMLDVNHRPAAGAPSCQQIGNPLFRVGIVPRSPSRIVEALLHVDEE
jgi:hypothetical protein